MFHSRGIHIVDIIKLSSSILLKIWIFNFRGILLILVGYQVFINSPGWHQHYTVDLDLDLDLVSAQDSEISRGKITKYQYECFSLVSIV